MLWHSWFHDPTRPKSHPLSCRSGRTGARSSRRGIHHGSTTIVVVVVVVVGVVGVVGGVGGVAAVAAVVGAAAADGGAGDVVGEKV